MPLSKYNKILAKKGDTKGAAAKTLANMKQEYGDKKGAQVFYAYIAKKERIKGGKSKSKKS